MELPRGLRNNLDNIFESHEPSVCILYYKKHIKVNLFLFSVIPTDFFANHAADFCVLHLKNAADCDIFFQIIINMEYYPHYGFVRCSVSDTGMIII